MADNKRIRVEKYGAPDDMDYVVTLDSDRDKVKYIKRIEQLIRSSMEYRDYIAYLKEYVNMKKCAFFSNVENDQGSRVRIEIHHEPFTLYDIVKTVINKYIDECIPLNDLFIADEVLELHYRNKVGLIPLSKSLHQIVHNSNEIVIPLQLIYGNYQDFIDEYKDYIDEEMIEKLECKIDETRTIKREMIEKLTPTYVYVETDGFSLPKKMVTEEKQAS